MSRYEPNISMASFFDYVEALEKLHDAVWASPVADDFSQTQIQDALDEVTNRRPGDPRTTKWVRYLTKDCCTKLDIREVSL